MCEVTLHLYEYGVNRDLKESAGRTRRRRPLWLKMLIQTLQHGFHFGFRVVASATRYIPIPGLCHKSVRLRGIIFCILKQRQSGVGESQLSLPRLLWIQLLQFFQTPCKSLYCVLGMRSVCIAVLQIREATERHRCCFLPGVVVGLEHGRDGLEFEECSD